MLNNGTFDERPDAGRTFGIKSEVLQWLITLALGAMVSYFVAQAATDRKIAVIDTREEIRWAETGRRLENVERNQAETLRSQQRIEARFENILGDFVRGIDRTTNEPLYLRELDRRQAQNPQTPKP
jgi:hypothetical protein